MRAKLLVFICIAFIAMLVSLNIYQYNKNADFESQLGTSYQRTVRESIYVLENDGDPKIWTKILKEKDGDLTFASHIGELTLLSRQFHKMDGKISMVGVLLDSLADDYSQLSDDIKNDIDYIQDEEEINKKTKFLISLLNEMDSISGENERRYYREFSNSESSTANLVWREYKKYEKQ